jgi:hypothetical protein
MSKSETYVINGISREMFERMKTDLRALGATVPDGDVCEVRHRGVSGAVVYSESDARVEVQITSKPFYVSDSVVRALLAKVVSRYAEEGSGANDSF